MNKVFALIFAFILIIGFKTKAQTDSLKTSGIGVKINLASYRFPGLQFETKLHKKKYIHFEICYRETNNKLSVDASSDKTSKLHLFADLRFYVGHKGPFQGFFVAPSLSLNYLRDQRFQTKQRDIELYDEKAFYFGGGLATGYQFLIKGRVLLDLYVGFGMLRQLIEKKDIAPDWDEFDDSLGEWWGVPRVALSIGFRFGKKI